MSDKPVLFEKTGDVSAEVTPETTEVSAISSIVIDNEFLKKRPLSYSSLKAFNVSPKDYIHYVFEPKKPPTESQTIGKVTECLLLEPEFFKKKFFVHADVNRRSNEGKALWQKYLTMAQVNNQTLVSDSEFEVAKECAKAVMENEKIKPYIDGVTRTQIKLEWIEKKYGLPMIGYADMEGDYNGQFVGEFKTTQDASDEGFPKQAVNYDYHIQIGMYSNGYHKKYYKFPNFFFIAAETNKPYKGNIFFCDPKYIEACREEVDYLLVSFKYCMDNNLWHQGYEFWQQSMPYGIMKLPGYAKLRSKI